MTSERDMTPLTDEQRFDLLEHPEEWPDDPELQAELAEMLELHLALRAHGDELDASLSEPRRGTWWRNHALGAAAAVALAVVPTVYAVYHGRAMAEQRKSAEYIQAVAQRRGQDRLWAAFFRQSSSLVHEFAKAPAVCGTDRDYEDRNRERTIALALIQKSHDLASSAPLAVAPEAEAIRASLHDWFRELSLEDGCLTPERAEQLRTLAKEQNLGLQAERLSKLLSGGES